MSQPDGEPAANRLVIAGVVHRTPDTRSAPSGIPLTRFTLEHRSQRQEAGLARPVTCRLRVLAAGDVFSAVVGRLRAGSQVRVSGFLHQGVSRYGRGEPELHVEHIELLD
ncbi:MAG: primosomal replication protein N [Gammaproteobacteria bacterium]